MSGNNRQHDPWQGPAQRGSQYDASQDYAQASSGDADRSRERTFAPYGMPYGTPQGHTQYPEPHRWDPSYSGQAMANGAWAGRAPGYGNAQGGYGQPDFGGSQYGQGGYGAQSFAAQSAGGPQRASGPQYQQGPYYGGGQQAGWSGGHGAQWGAQGYGGSSASYPQGGHGAPGGYGTQQGSWSGHTGGQGYGAFPWGAGGDASTQWGGRNRDFAGSGYGAGSDFRTLATGDATPQSSSPYGADATYAARERSRLRRGPKGWQRSDERIREDLCERLYDREDLDASDVTVEVREGRVTLEGTVQERWHKHALEDLADSLPGVKDVENRVRVHRGGPWPGTGSQGTSAPGSVGLSPSLTGSSGSTTASSRSRDRDKE